MSSAASDHLHSASLLRRSLDDAAAALTSADLERLLECETRIEAALTCLSTSRLTPEARPRLLREIADARVALDRCRTLGASLDDFIRLRLAAQGADGGYGPSGAGVSTALQTIRRTV